MYSKLKVGKSYKSINRDGTHLYFKVIDINTHSKFVRIFVYRDDDTATSLASVEYTVAQDREYLINNRVTELTDDELLAVIL